MNDICNVLQSVLIYIYPYISTLWSTLRTFFKYSSCYRDFSSHILSSQRNIDHQFQSAFNGIENSFYLIVV